MSPAAPTHMYHLHATSHSPPPRPTTHDPRPANKPIVARPHDASDACVWPRPLATQGRVYGARAAYGAQSSSDVGISDSVWAAGGGWCMLRLWVAAIILGAKVVARWRREYLPIRNVRFTNKSRASFCRTQDCSTAPTEPSRVTPVSARTHPSPPPSIFLPASPRACGFLVTGIAPGYETDTFVITHPAQPGKHQDRWYIIRL
jgi:hypothetical protein